VSSMRWKREMFRGHEKRSAEQRKIGPGGDGPSLRAAGPGWRTFRFASVYREF